MRYKILLYGLIAAAVTSCSSAYKASQTPDDVYYSPAKAGVQKETVKKDKYENYISSEDDQYLHMKIRDRSRWAGIDDYTYWNDSRYVPSYNYNYDYYRNNMYNTYAWNNWNTPYSNLYYSPFYSGYGFGYTNNYYYPKYGYNTYGSSYISKYPVRTISPSVNRPNLNGYRNGLYNNTNSNNNSQGFGSTLKRVFSPSENSSYSNSNNNSTYTAPQRNYTPAPSSSSSSSSSSGSSSSGGSSSGGATRPPR